MQGIPGGGKYETGARGQETQVCGTRWFGLGEAWTVDRRDRAGLPRPGLSVAPYGRPSLPETDGPSPGNNHTTSEQLARLQAHQGYIPPKTNTDFIETQGVQDTEITIYADWPVCYSATQEKQVHVSLSLGPYEGLRRLPMAHQREDSPRVYLLTDRCIAQMYHIYV